MPPLAPLVFSCALFTLRSPAPCALLPACAYQIIAHILLFFDIFHSLKKIAKKDKPETASITALPGLSFFFFVFIIFLIFFNFSFPCEKAS